MGDKYKRCQKGLRSNHTQTETKLCRKHNTWQVISNILALKMNKCQGIPFLFENYLSVFVASTVFLCSPTALLWWTVLPTGWSVTCGVYVSVCLSVYSEPILTHSINLSYNRSTPTCPFRGASCIFGVLLPLQYERTTYSPFFKLFYTSDLCMLVVCVRAWCNRTRSEGLWAGASRSMQRCFMFSCLV